MRPMEVLTLALAITGGGAMAQVVDEGALRAKGAREFRGGDESVTPAPDGTIFCEAEEFKVEKPGWQARSWGENYYWGTFANTFLSRKAFLGAPADCDETVATINVDVKEAGKYLVLVRYEAAYRFETQFKVKVEQRGAGKLDRLYGARKNLKIWAFGNKLKDEVAWPWGAVENVVWEGHDAYAELQPGPAKITLTAGKQPAPQAKRNVDLVMLTRDEKQVKERIEKEAYLPLDGMLTQAGDVYLKIANDGAAKVTVKSLEFPGGPMRQHSPYWTHQRNWKPIQVEVEPGKTTDWIEVGGTMDTLNDGQWGFNASAPCRIEVGLKDAAGRIQSIRSFEANANLDLVCLADMRYVRRVVTPEELTRELFDHVKNLPVHGKPIERTYIMATGALPREFYTFYGLNGANRKGPNEATDVRGKDAAQLEQWCEKLSQAERDNMLVVSLGDEISLPEPESEVAGEGFIAFLKALGTKPGDVDPSAGGEWARISYPADLKKPEVADALKAAKPGLYYWAHRYLYRYGIQEMKKLTDVLHKNLPNAHIGANFSPHHGGGEYTFLGETFKWVSCFRQDGLTLPWSEDYIWQVPVGTPQMNGINLDLFRAGQRGKPGRKILYYVMPHMPGNIPSMWRRLWHNAIGHGATILNLFEFDPVWVAHTENYVTGKTMYAAVLKAIRELGLYEDIVQDGQVRPAQTALWFGETGDIWRDNFPPFGAAKRSLYCAILHNQVPLDFVVEDDAVDGTLGKYTVLFLADNHVSRTASAKIAEWVKDGGRLFTAAGAGMFDESNQPNRILRELLGVEMTEMVKPADQRVDFIKQDLPFLHPMGEVTLKDPAAQFPFFSVKAKIKPASGATVLGTFADGSAAVVANKAGKGETLTCAFLPGLSYFKPAIPMKPLDRGGSEDAMSHFIPTAFDRNVAALVGSVVRSLPRPAAADHSLVETSVIESKSGTAIVLGNWSGKALPGMKLTVSIPVPVKSVTLASGTKVDVKKDGGRTVCTFDMDASGDVLILR